MENKIEALKQKIKDSQVKVDQSESKDTTEFGAHTQDIRQIVREEARRASENLYKGISKQLNQLIDNDKQTKASLKYIEQILEEFVLKGGK